MDALHPTIDRELRSLLATLTANGTIPPAAVLQKYYDTFRSEFGPDVLAALDGQELLERMHAHGRKDSLVYWLEFKEDETLPTSLFGSISGGSALKFGVFRRKETGTWATKGPSNYPKDISVDEAISIARRHRDQLLAAVRVLERKSPSTDDAHYARIQDELRQAAPDVEDLAWGHKYLSLLFPDLLDDFHVASFQRYHLIRCLQLPPLRDGEVAEGRYESAGRFVALSQYLGCRMHDTCMVLNRRHGSPVKYWRVGTTDDQNVRRKFWPMMRDNGVIAIGWPKLGDLSEFATGSGSREALKEHIRKHYPAAETRVGRESSELMHFLTSMEERHRVVAADGQTALGVAEIIGPYRYAGDSEFPHQRAVEWKSLAEWKMPEGVRTSVFRIKDPAPRIAIERRVLDDRETVTAPRRPTEKAPPGVSEHPPSPQPHRGTLPRLSGTSGTVQAILERKGQAILYGPPGTGKTYWTMRATRDLASLRAFGRDFASLNEVERAEVVTGSSGRPALVRMTTFHPEYGYEDFIEGYRPSVNGGGALTFSLAEGVFRALCRDARRQPDRDYYLIIDEINRGDIPRIFGELLTLLEWDKRGTEVRLPLSGEPFTIPTNVFVVGTMNTADRSIALLDVALRRRFGFVELMPDYSLLRGIAINGLPLAEWLAALNERVREKGGGDARNRQIGHAFFLPGGAPIKTIEQFTAVLRDDILPLLEEYCYDDISVLADLVGRSLVDVEGQRVRRELFDPARSTELISALMTPDVATATSSAALGEEGSGAEPDDDEGGEDSE